MGTDRQQSVLSVHLAVFFKEVSGGEQAPARAQENSRLPSTPRLLSRGNRQIKDVHRK